MLYVSIVQREKCSLLCQALSKKENLLWRVYKVGKKWKKKGEDKDGGIQDSNEMLKMYLKNISLSIMHIFSVPKELYGCFLYFKWDFLLLYSGIIHSNKK